eukprot:165111-Rhodomonas_salina.1
MQCSDSPALPHTPWSWALLGPPKILWRAAARGLSCGGGRVGGLEGGTAGDAVTLRARGQRGARAACSTASYGGCGLPRACGRRRGTCHRAARRRRRRRRRG